MRAMCWLVVLGLILLVAGSALFWLLFAVLATALAIVVALIKVAFALLVAVSPVLVPVLAVALLFWVFVRSRRPRHAAARCDYGYQDDWRERYERYDRYYR